MTLTFPRFLLAATAALGISLTAQAQDTSARAAWHAQIGHGYQQLANLTEQFASKADAYCATPSSDSLNEVKTAWSSAFAAWQAVRFVDFGPIEQNTRAWKFQFWPDPKNLTANKASYWLNPERGEITEQALARDSVAIQGFPAAEYLLFDAQVSNSDKALPDARSCQLLTAIAHNLQTNASGLSSDWDQLQARYLDVTDYDNGTLTAAMHGLEIMADWRLAAPLGARGNGKPNPYLADAWRSGQSLDMIQASLQGLADYFVPGLNTLMAEHDALPLAEQFSTQLNQTLARFDTLPADITPLLESEEGVASLNALLADVRATGQLLTGPIAAELNVVRGFNSSDGD